MISHIGVFCNANFTHIDVFNSASLIAGFATQAFKGDLNGTGLFLARPILRLHPLLGGEDTLRGFLVGNAAQFDQKNPYAFVLDNMEKYQIKPEWINLEITETASSDMRQILLLNMRKLINKGIMFSLDDFGTGRSNLDYFITMPVKNIKFDYSFTQGYFKNVKTRHVVKGMIGIIRNMGLQVISEGVETEEQLDTMIALGVHYIQGFYFSKPIPGDQFLTFLAERNNPKQA